MQHTLIAVFDNRGDAQAAKDELYAAGFSGAEIRQSDGATAGGTTVSGSATGTTTSTTTAGSTDEGFGAGIRHFFADLFGGDDSAAYGSRYADAVARGQHVLTLVTASEQEVERAADIVERHGPVDIDEESGGQFVAGGQSMSGGASMSAQSGAQSGAQLGAQSATQASVQSGAPGAQIQGGVVAPQGGSAMGQQNLAGGLSGDMSQGSQQRAQGAAESTVLPVIEEELRVGKREVQRGGVRIFQRMVETPVSETVNLREEHVSVERRPVDQPVAPADLAAFQEKSIEVRETAEEAVVEKSARVVEEVVVGKQVTQTQQEIADTVRRTEVDVEQLAGTGATGSTGMAASTGMGSSAGIGGSAPVANDAASTASGTAMGMLGADDDDYFRKHYDATYATGGRGYQDYVPAYSYGSTMAATDTYRGRAWDDVEPALRQDWESRNPGSAWDSFKAAVRHGWEKITG